MKAFLSLGAGLALALASTLPGLALTDRAFLQKAIEGDNSEIQMGELAQSKGASPAVKNFGQMLQADHARARSQAEALARQMGVTATMSVPAEARQEMVKLQRLSGPAFDKEFAAFMVKDHQKDIYDYRTQAEHGQGELANFAKMSVPVLEKHLEMARSLKASGA